MYHRHPFCNGFNLRDSLVGGAEGDAIRKSLGGCSKPRFSLRQPLAHFKLLEIGPVVHMVRGCTQYCLAGSIPLAERGPRYGRG